MNSLDAYNQLRSLDVPVLRTGDVARYLEMPDSTAQSALDRLAKAGLVEHVWRGVWALDPELDPLVLPPYLTGAFPSYISFETALFYHDMIQQIPPRITVASLHRSATIRTSRGTNLVHQVPPTLYGGFEEHNHIRMAGPEKVLIDLAYIRSHRSTRNTRMPEIEVPASLKRDELASWIERISAKRMRSLVRSTLGTWGVPNDALPAG